MVKETDLEYLDNLSDCIVHAAIHSDITKQQLIDLFWERGVVSIYHLGMQHMYEYLEENNELR